MPNILPEELSRLALQNPPNCASHFADLVEARKNWFTSVFDENMRMVAAFLKITGTGEGQTDKVFDPYGNEVIHPTEKEEYLHDSASIEIAEWIRAGHADIDIGGVTRTYSYQSRGHRYNFDLRTGEPRWWLTDTTKYIWEDFAKPGNVLR
ncbi:hypothetical protein PanWU01x14_341500 [Parasponia andersonii]|uniref:Uncharacterized protein n=1 Tax=Parasponia andersonii TaxID=3476 RepID=A0A2P5AE32_PARAD|nr:hypothetical protein PanWU01x14_341500 [Parasponia andersonii]